VNADAIAVEAARSKGTLTDVRAFCIRLLGNGDLETKLVPPMCPDGSPLADAAPGPPLLVDRPVRAVGLELAAGAPPLPRPGELASPEARASCLARFAHHELMAVELFAWALLRWPELPAELRRGWLVALRDEQKHCGLYLERLYAHGSKLDDHVLSDYFWKHAPAIAASPHGPRAFLSAMGLTFEQANLDFSLLYRDAFREAGDEASARACQVIHDDEVGHVALAARWLERLSEPDRSETERYSEAVPFPLSAARAKARRFDVAARRRAGLGEEFIDYVRSARSTQETQPRRPRDS
jgi:uncharacterized ferritin-like protein (DUF455 family)